MTKQFNSEANLNLLTSATLLLAGLTLAARLNGASVNQYDVIVADSQATIYAFSPQTGQRAIISQGNNLNRPYDLARKQDGNIVVSDTGTLSIVQVNPLTGQQTVLAQGSALGVPYGIDVDQQNRIYVANSQCILSIAPDTGLVQIVAQGGLLQVPLDVAVGADGCLYVADAMAGVIRIDLVSKQQTLLPKGRLSTPTGITTDGSHTAYVVDGGGQCVVSIDLQTGAQKPVSSGGYFATPVGIAFTGGNLLVSDPDALNLDGGVMMIMPDGSQKLLARGSGDLVNARGIVLVPDFLAGKTGK